VKIQYYSNSSQGRLPRTPRTVRTHWPARLASDLSGNGAASIVRGLYVSSDFFCTLGVKTFIGRPLTPSDDSPSAPNAIVLNYAYWVRDFGAAPSAVGRTVRLDSTTVTTVGVTDPHFANLTPGKSLDFFMPFSLADSVRGKWWGDEDRLSDPTESTIELPFSVPRQ
jgi:hypothetical protein